ncbi:hexokinase type 2-like [Diaphorina citri]|uniref:Phosphotransferase n=1 Tax=Diaphorina citri TaxID=121845 RepID=A0A3Q0IXU2_DIACI|nr:hexokinase type 2-like [Diaphorina citri]
MRPTPELISEIYTACYCEWDITKKKLLDGCGHESVDNVIREHCKDLVLSDEQLREVMSKLLLAINKGLDKNTNKEAVVKCFPTYVQDLPNGKEKGKFLALDLGGTNFRVLIIYLEENHFKMESKVYSIPQDIMTGSGTQVSILIGLSPTPGVGNPAPAGLFSCARGGLMEKVFPIAKNPDCYDVQIEVCAILNDTTGCLMSCAWKNRNCRVGIICGTGCNACYVERCDNVGTFDNESGKPYVIINTEWGAMGDGGALDFILTPYDREVDAASVHPGKQTFEKMISGMYMGEIVRLALQKFTKQGLLFNGQGSDQLFTREAFLTKYVSEIESEPKGTHTICLSVLAGLGLPHASEQDAINVRYVCECVSRRAAHLVSAGAACLINKMDFEHVTVAVDGSVYRFHPHFHDLMMEKIGQLISKNIQVRNQACREAAHERGEFETPPCLY